jgi:hypothetical protein
MVGLLLLGVLSSLTTKERFSYSCAHVLNAYAAGVVKSVKMKVYRMNPGRRGL